MKRITKPLSLGCFGNAVSHVSCCESLSFLYAGVDLQGRTVEEVATTDLGCLPLALSMEAVLLCTQLRVVPFYLTALLSKSLQSQSANSCCQKQNVFSSSELCVNVGLGACFLHGYCEDIVTVNC